MPFLMAYNRSFSMRKPRLSQFRSTPTKAQHQSEKAGFPPGTVLYVGREREGQPVVSSLSFATEQGELRHCSSLRVEELRPQPEEARITWINVDGVHEAALVQAIGEVYDIHPLTQEDIANTEQRPKAEEFGHYLFVIVKMISFDEDNEHIHIGQVSLVLTKNQVLTFQEETKDVFDPLRERLQVGGTRLRRYGADYLFFALLDIIVSNYFLVTEQLSERLTLLERDIIEKSDQEALTDMQHRRKSLQSLKKAILPLREVVSYCMRSDSRLIDSRNRAYFRELSDQVNQVMDTLSGQQDSLNNLQSLYLALASQKTNEVMKVLTVISTIFLPLSFLAGIYGMNFDHMPELHWRYWRYSYYLLWGFILLLIGGMLLYFRYKKWL